MRKKILVTGAGGFIGGRMLEWLEKRSIDVTGWVRTQVDLEDRAAVSASMANLNPDVVFHFASIPAQESDNDWRVILREVSMLDAIAASVPRQTTIIYCGSMAEIGYSGQHDEQVWCRPNTLYGMAKFAATNRALALAHNGYSIRIARLFGVYGPGEAASRLIPTLVRKLTKAEPVSLSDGEQIRDFVHVDDVCTALWSLAPDERTNIPTLVNVGTGQGIKVKDACRLVATILGSDMNLLKFGAQARRYVDESILIADSRLLRVTTGLILPQHLGEASERLIDYVKDLAVQR